MKPWLPLPSSHDAGGRRRIVLVDDDPRSRYVLAELLRSEGFTVQTAAGHESWLALFRTCLSSPATWVSFIAALEPQAILLDLGLRDGTALPTLSELRRHPITERVPVVVIGRPARMREVDTAMALGASSFVLRPLSRAGLGPSVEAALATVPEEQAPLLGDETPVINLC